MDQCQCRNPLQINQGIKRFNRWDHGGNTALSLAGAARRKSKPLLRLPRTTRAQEQGKTPSTTSFKRWDPFRKVMEAQAVLTISFPCCCQIKTCKSVWISTELNWVLRLLISQMLRHLRICNLSIFHTINYLMLWTISELRRKRRAQKGDGRAMPRKRGWHRPEGSKSAKE